MAFRRLSSLALAGLVVAAMGCNCGGQKLQTHHCTADADCSTDGTKFCDKNGLDGDDATGCHVSTFECTNEGQCCPGQICSSGASICFDKWVQCTAGDNSTCTVKGQVCEPPYDGADPGCVFQKCGKDPDTGANTACADGLSCFNGYCVGEPPCNGGCQSGSVCTPVNNRCFHIDDPNKPYDPSCSESCAPGTILVFKDGSNVFNRCNRNRDAEKCECEPLPPVRANDLARYSSAAASGDELLVSAYDGDHGDLVVHEYDKATLKLKKTTWLDGVPTTGAVVGDPNGPRGGRVAKGEDVGRYTALAYDAATTTTHIAYYAVEDDAQTPPTPLGNLKYASRQGAGDWKTSLVDGQAPDGTDTGDVGMYASIAVSPDGYPVIAYFERSGVGNESLETAVKVARAKVQQPAGPNDWTITTVDTGARTPPPCANPACQPNEVCTASDANPNGVCRAKAASDSACSPACKSTQACALDAGGSPVCFDSLRASTLADLPEGDGLFTSIAYLDDKPVVVWYDHAKGQLKGVVAKSDSAAGGAQFQASDVKVLDDGVVPGAPAGQAPHDVGRFASLAVGPSDAAHRLAVAYFDATSRQLKVLTADAGWTNETPPDARVVDDGTGSNPEEDAVLFVGADASVRFDAAKNLEVVYQDSTSNDLRLAVQQPGSSAFTLSTVAHDGAAGFYARLVVDGADRYATTAVIKAKSASESANQLLVTKLP